MLWGASGGAIPAVGMGTSRTFNVGTSEALRKKQTRSFKSIFSKWEVS